MRLALSSTSDDEWRIFNLGRTLLDYCAAIMPRYMEDAIKTILIKFPGVSRNDIVGEWVTNWSDARQEWVYTHTPGWDFEVLNSYYSTAKDIIAAEKKAAESRK